VDEAQLPVTLNRAAVTTCMLDIQFLKAVMKTLGLIGGMSWESTALYYRRINEIVRDRLGSSHSAQILLYSYDFEAIRALQYEGEWDAAGASLAETAGRLERAGAQAIVLCTNTMHKVAPAIARHISVPFLHLAEETARAIECAGYKYPALLGTRFTMEEDFYKQSLIDRGLRVRVPPLGAIEDINRVIYDELCQGKVLASSRARFAAIIKALADQDADCVILGCTEITMLIEQKDSALPVFDTTEIHAKSAALFALGEA
jgi:aspartate racemase